MELKITTIREEYYRRKETETIERKKYLHNEIEKIIKEIKEITEKTTECAL